MTGSTDNAPGGRENDPASGRHNGPAPGRRNGAAVLEAVAVMDRLRSPGGCPWDAEQTHASLAPYAVEEAHELVEAAESGDRAALREELGDVLLQVLFHSRIAAEDPDGFDIDDVARALVDKLIYRHPHVFADEGTHGLSRDQVEEQWDRLKAAQQQRSWILEGIPESLPALARAQKVLGRIATSGSQVGAEPVPSAGGPAEPDAKAHEEVGARLLDVVRQARDLGVDAEAALRTQIRHLEDAVRPEPDTD